MGCRREPHFKGKIILIIMKIIFFNSHTIELLVRYYDKNAKSPSDENINEENKVGLAGERVLPLEKRTNNVHN